MRIAAIRGKNLASLEDPFVLDFTAEPLQSAGIFAITGPTGSGKSTLLDALCLALFDSVPRIQNAENVAMSDMGGKTINQKDSRTVLRKGAVEGYAEVDFVSLSGESIRSRWSVRRAGNKSNGTLQATELQVKNLSSGTDLQGTKKELLAAVSQLIGLTFEQFTRTVLLAQGDFATFLKADKHEKAALLEKLTGTDIYSRISMTIFEKTKAVGLEYKAIADKINDIELLTEEQRLTFATERQALENKLKESELQLKTIETKIKWLEEKTRMERTVADAVTAWERAKNAIAEARPRFDYMKESDSVQAIRDTFTSLQAANKQLADNQLAIKEKKANLETVKKQSEEAEKQSAHWENEQTKVEEAWKKFEPDVQRAQTLDIQTDNARKNETEARKEYEKALADVDKINKNIRQLTTERSDRQVKLDAERARFSKLLHADVARLKTQLRDGEPCPVCGSTHHPAGQTTETTALEKMAAEWTDCDKNIRESENRIAALDAQLKGEHGKLTEATEHLAGKENRKNELAKLTAGLQTERSKLLHGIAVTEFQQRYEAKKREIAEKLKQANHTKDKLKETVSGLNGFIARIENSITELQRQIARLTQEKEAWKATRTQPISDEQLAGFFLKSTQWIENERKSLSDLHTQENAAQATLKERENNLKHHLEAAVKPEKEKENRDFLNVQKRQFETLRTETRERETNLKVAIQKDEENRTLQQKYAKELKEKGALYETWKKLNDLLGSADGAKFKTIAQGYTLDVLLVYANKHLQELSGRYELQRIPDTLALQVADLDMMGEVRTVHSLSGGESFLLSLALALGLSSLSSNNMRVESLFIDEGFGSLDTDTLRLAMDALERLQTQGRKIGVISHVAEMTERIAVQIRVIKIANGKSKVQVGS